MHGAAFDGVPALEVDTGEEKSEVTLGYMSYLKESKPGW